MNGTKIVKINQETWKLQSVKWHIFCLPCCIILLCITAVVVVLSYLSLCFISSDADLVAIRFVCCFFSLLTLCWHIFSFLCYAVNVSVVKIQSIPPSVYLLVLWHYWLCHVKLLLTGKRLAVKTVLEMTNNVEWDVKLTMLCYPSVSWSHVIWRYAETAAADIFA